MREIDFILWSLRRGAHALLQRLADRLAAPPVVKPVPATLPRARVVTASFSFALPTDGTPQQVEDWLAFVLGSGSIDGDNPFLDDEIQSVGSISLQDTGLHAHTHAYRHEGKVYLSSVLSEAPYTGPTSHEILQRLDHPAIVDRMPPWMAKETQGGRP